MNFFDRVIVCVQAAGTFLLFLVPGFLNAASMVNVQYRKDGEVMVQATYTGKDGDSSSDPYDYWTLLGTAPQSVGETRVSPDGQAGLTASLKGAIAISIEIRGRISMGEITTDRLALKRDHGDSQQWYLPQEELARILALSPKHPLIHSVGGNLPIILTASHGGTREVPGVPARTGNGDEDFNPRVDAWTFSLTRMLADEIEKETGKRPYLVAARFHRKFIDANRPPELAYESVPAKPVYDAFHREVDRVGKEVIGRWGSGMILDIHGQSAEADVTFRGTKNGRTTGHLLEKYGKEALIGETSLFGQLAKQGLKVDPAVGSSDRENPEYNGGHLVTSYGTGAMDAIQLELGFNLRKPENQEATVKKLAAAIRSFAGKYLPAAGIRD